MTEIDNIIWHVGHVGQSLCVGAKVDVLHELAVPL